MAADPEACAAMGYRAQALYNAQYAMENGTAKYGQLLCDVMNAMKGCEHPNM
jgi:hypothetical protein